MAKRKVEKPKRKLTRRQLSHWQQQKRRQRFILGIGVSVVIAALGLVAAGIYYQWYIPESKPLKETVIEVNGTEFSMGYYIDALKLQAEGQSSQLVQYLLAPVLESIQQSELIRQEALALGFSISDDEVDEKLRDSGLPINAAVRDIVRTQLLITQLEEEYFGAQVPGSAEQRYIMAMFLESEEQATDVGARLEAGEDFGELAGELSLDSLTQENNGDLGWRPKGVLGELLDTTVAEDFILGYPVGVLSFPIYDSDKTKDLGYWLIKVLERNNEEEAHVQAMLLSSEEEAKIVISRLETGEDFVQLAEEFSQYGIEGSKAEIGWIAEGDMTQQAFNDYVFSPETELNVVSGIIRDEEATTSGGYWLFKVLDDDTREIAGEDREMLVSQDMDEWMALTLDNPENIIVSYLDNEMREFAISKVIGG